MAAILVCLSMYVTAQRDTVLFTGINGKLVSEESADRKKVVEYQSRGRVLVTSYSRHGELWRMQYRERFRKLGDNSYRMQVKGEGISGTYIRKYEKSGSDNYRFEEIFEESLVKTGHTRQMFPLILHGEVTEYYGNGKIKSRSLYNDNRLISNENWYETGEKYFDNIFYSADSEPMYSRGMAEMHLHLRRAFLESGVDVSTVSGNILLGFVVMEDGAIDGIRVLKGITPSLNAVAVNAIKSLEGSWKPAVLDGRNIRYFQLFPINFIYRENRFESVEFNGSMIHWDIN